MPFNEGRTTTMMPIPEMGDTGALADVVKRTEKMAEAIVPLLDAYFARRETGDS